MITVTTLRPLEFWPAVQSHPKGKVPAYINCTGEPFVLPKDTKCLTIVEGPCTRFLARAEDVQAFRILSRDEFKEVA